MDSLQLVLQLSSDLMSLLVQHKTPRAGISFFPCLLAEFLPSASVLCVKLLLSPLWSGHCLRAAKLISNLKTCLL